MHRLRYGLTFGSVIALFGMVAIAPQLSWSSEPEVSALYQPGEMPTQEAIAAASVEAEHYLAALEVETLPEPEPEPEPEEEVTEAQEPSIAAPIPTYSGGGSPEAWMTAAGIAPENWGYVDFIASRESGWNPNATNPTSGACGLIQAYPCSKVPGGGYDPVANLTWANSYAQKYGGWNGAYDFWRSNNWW
ncbi:MAG: transglycosylase SLT domain-containing protein [Microbacteriaceae bacterium]